MKSVERILHREELIAGVSREQHHRVSVLDPESFVTLPIEFPEQDRGRHGDED